MSIIIVLILIFIFILHKLLYFVRFRKLGFKLFIFDILNNFLPDLHKELLLRREYIEECCINGIFLNEKDLKWYDNFLNDILICTDDGNPKLQDLSSGYILNKELGKELSKLYKMDYTNISNMLSSMLFSYNTIIMNRYIYIKCMNLVIDFRNINDYIEKVINENNDDNDLNIDSVNLYLKDIKINIYLIFCKKGYYICTNNKEYNMYNLSKSPINFKNDYFIVNEDNEGNSLLKKVCHKLSKVELLYLLLKNESLISNNDSIVEKRNEIDNELFKYNGSIGDENGYITWNDDDLIWAVNGYARKYEKNKYEKNDFIEYNQYNHDPNKIDKLIKAGEYIFNNIYGLNIRMYYHSFIKDSPYSKYEVDSCGAVGPHIYKKINIYDPRWVFGYSEVLEDHLMNFRNIKYSFKSNMYSKDVRFQDVNKNIR